MKENKLNELDAKSWLKFTKSWFLHHPAPRKEEEKLHPAKYPESLVKEFVLFFTKRNDWVLDPFSGTGSTSIACQETGRNSIGIELIDRYASIAERRVKKLESQKRLFENPVRQIIIKGDSFKIEEIFRRTNLPPVDFLITSPPYGPMLNKRGLAQERRIKKNLDTKYSNEENDLGNILDYQKFTDKLAKIFFKIKENNLLKKDKYLVVIIQNYVDGQEYRTLAWDFASKMKKHFLLKGERIWLQDNKSLFPYGCGYQFVPNVHHHYCLVFRNSKG